MFLTERDNIMKEYKTYQKHKMPPQSSRATTEPDRLSHDYFFKFHVIGDSGVGKSCLLLRFTDYVYPESYISTIGIDFKVRNMDYDGRIIKLQVWDTPGQERFGTIRSQNYGDGHGVLLIYDVTDIESFNNIKIWNHEVARYWRTTVKLVLVGAKSDLKGKRQVDFEMGMELANKLGIPFIETSAKTSSNVEEAFRILASEVLSDLCRAPVLLPKLTLASPSPSKFLETLRELNEKKFSPIEELAAPRKRMATLVDSFYNEKEGKDSEMQEKIIELAHLSSLSLQNIAEYLKRNQQNMNAEIIKNIKLYLQSKSSLEEKNVARKKLNELQRNLLAFRNNAIESPEGFFDFGRKKSVVAELTKMIDSIAVTLESSFVKKTEEISSNAKKEVNVNAIKFTIEKEFKNWKESIDKLYEIVLDKKIDSAKVLEAGERIEKFKHDFLEYQKKFESAKQVLPPKLSILIKCINNPPRQGDLKSDQEFKVLCKAIDALIEKINEKVEMATLAELQVMQEALALFPQAESELGQLYWVKIVNILSLYRDMSPKPKEEKAKPMKENDRKARERVMQSERILSTSTVTLLAPPPASSSAPKEEEIPDQFICPISREIMTDPVVVSSGHTFDRSNFETWVKQEIQAGKEIFLCPMARTKLACDHTGQVMMFPNIALRQLIEKYNSEASKKLVSKK